jgi:hypothetical protein
LFELRESITSGSGIAVRIDEVRADVEFGPMLGSADGKGEAKVK